MLTIPTDFTSTNDAVMTNFDHAIDEDVAKEIKGKPLYAQYAGWNFCGEVWWTGEKWACEIHQWRSHVDTVEANTLQEIMDEVSDRYGHD